MRAHRTASLALAGLMWLPPVALASAPTDAIVTRVGGHVIASASGALTPLAFKDTVRPGETIRTGAGAGLRLLLDGRALVSVGELSSVTLGGSDGRRALDLESGRLALSLSPETPAGTRVIEVRTANAVVIPEGGVVAVEVSRATADATGSARGAVTNIWVLRGRAVVGTRASAGSARVEVEAPARLAVVGDRVGEPAALGTLPATQIGWASGGPEPAQPPDTLWSQEHAKAAALARALAGDEGADDLGTEALAVAAPGDAGGPSPAAEVPLLPTLPPPAARIVPPTPLFLYQGQTANQAGDLLQVPALTTRTLAQPLLRAAGSTVTVGNEVIDVSGTLTATNSWPLVELSASTLTARNLAVVRTGGRFSLVGGLLDVTGGAVTWTDDGVAVTGTGRLTSTGAASLLRLDGTTLTAGNGAGDQLFVVSGAGAQASLAGALLTAAGSTLGVRGAAMVEVSSSGVLTDSSPGALVSLSGGTLDLLAGTPGFLLNSLGVATLAGPLFESQGTALTGTGNFLRGLGGGQLVSGSTAPLASVAGGVSAIATASGSAFFRLSGTATAPDPESGLTVGTERPIQHAGAFLDTAGATLGTRRIVAVDRALLEASAPLLQARAASLLTTSTHTIDVTNQAKVTGTAPVIALDGASRLTLTGGSAINVAGASYFRVTGDAITLANASQLQINSGTLLYASGGSQVLITGALVAFGGTGGNAVTVTNALCPCTSIGGLQVRLSGGALAANVSITGTPIKNPALGTVTLGTPSSAHIRLDGATTRVTIQGL